MKKLIFIFILAISFTSCSSDDTDKNEIIEDDSIATPSLIGEWNWVESCGGISYDCSYPPEDHKEMVEFKDDLTYIEKINNITEVESTYLVTDTIFVVNSAYFEIEFGFEFNTEFTFYNDTLSIVWGDYWKNYTRITD